VRQRSRWLKGFLVTYCVHMRQPRVLLKDLGFWRFMGVQAVFLAAVAQFVLAPVLWSFWLALAGVSHPLATTLGSGALSGLIAFFIAGELLSLCLGLVALHRKEHRHLIPFLPSMIVYFALGPLAAYKALWELVYVPFFWDKTQHGVTAQTDPVPQRSKDGGSLDYISS
jgi:hypothetical protein